MNDVLGGFLIWFGILAAYLMPSVVALVRRVPNRGSVIVVNVLLGWLVVGWIVALAMACRSKPPRRQLPAATPSGWPYGPGWSSAPPPY